MPGHRPDRRVAASSSSSRAGATTAGPPRPSAADLDRWFPPTTLEVPADAARARRRRRSSGTCPGPGITRSATRSKRRIEDAARRIHIVNPYISNRAILARLLAAAQRGVSVELVAPGKPTPPYPAAAFRHHYQRLIDAGATILLHPDMAHAKVLSIDDRVFIGGCNLDDLSLFRNDEIDLLFEDPDIVALTEAQVFDELVAMSDPRRRPDGFADAGLERDDGSRLESALGRRDAPLPRRGRHRCRHRAGDPHAALDHPRPAAVPVRDHEASRSSSSTLPAFWVFLVAGVAIGLVNRLVRPLIVALTGRLVLSTMGAFLVVVNAISLWIATLFAPQLAVTASPTAAVVPGRRRAVHRPVVGRRRRSSGSTSPILDDQGEGRSIWRLLDALPTPRRNRIIENVRLQQVYDTIYRYGLDIALERTPIASFRNAFQRRVLGRIAARGGRPPRRGSG